MPKLSNIILAMLVLGLVYAEFLPTLSTPEAAYSSIAATPNQSELLLSFFNPTNKREATVVAPAGSVIFIQDIAEVPDKLINIAEKTGSLLSIDYAVATDKLPLSNDQSPAAIIYQPPVTDTSNTSSFSAPPDSALIEAYTAGGFNWYEEGDQVIVIFPSTQSFRSFQKSTGTETNWLQDRLQYAPLDAPGALENYLVNYHGQIVAETTTWVLVKFPSGTYLKIAKPTGNQSASTPTSGPFFAQQ
ncbi:TPA: hypothetical protein DCR79_00260 [Patescibacteria group bacterium]|uniref:Uncharacterized protein n=2 Tax=Bacteria division Kazan-3B-28 TaxID=1798534 RepID=A0A0G1KUS4_UNCK3|nr:MAG: hypothetical protein VE96_C0019G0004 [candidate division Kazan bacterium GW2011_GWA1_44_22]KKT87250.1 MAG: hypothetical protein VE97_C0002G0004 [candidate division Kazan bacterium GW2011_GWB1_45_10]HAR54715.1 hypothetical protein [Patescibacteria group bacterium]HCR42179.1 hypothetical protein [Patescibacteria group bacterium]